MPTRMPAVAAAESWKPVFQSSAGECRSMHRRATPRLFSVFAGRCNSVPSCGTANISTARMTAGDPPVTGTYTPSRQIAMMLAACGAKDGGEAADAGEAREPPADLNSY